MTAWNAPVTRDRSVSGITAAKIAPMLMSRTMTPIAIAAYLGGSDVFDKAITQFAVAYADQNEHDHQALVDAVRSGRITAEPGV